jgi:hypothetical protein
MPRKSGSGFLRFGRAESLFLAAEPAARRRDDEVALRHG